MIGDIEQGLIDKVDAAHGDAQSLLGYRFKTLGSYGGELEAPPEEIAKRSPFLLAMFAGITNSEDIGPDEYKHTAGFTLIIGNRDRRNNEVTRRGAGAKPGSYQLVTDVLKLVCGDDLGLDIERIQPGRVRPLANSKSLSIYAAEVSTKFISVYPTFIADLDDFETFNADWDVPPPGDVSTTLPADDADATDTVTLETE